MQAAPAIAGPNPAKSSLGASLVASLALAMNAGESRAGPQHGNVRAGSATITSTPSVTTITQTSARAVIDWSSFNIGAGESVTFNQPGASAAVLNRVTGSQFSSLAGTLTANGQVYLVNPNGILIGNGANISAAGFVASTASIGTAAFMVAPDAANGRYAFNELSEVARGGSIVNAGSITVADGGLVALVAPAVRNSGVITARLGKVALASANYYTLDLFGDDLIRVAVGDSIANRLSEVTGAAVNAQVDVDGQVRADGGRIVLLSVPAAADAVSSAVNLSGLLRAHSVAAGQEGTILLLADSGATRVSGVLDARGSGSATRGGRIEIHGSEIAVAGAARIDASGNAGGGFIGIGGRFASGARITETATTQVAADTVVQACGVLGCPVDGSGGTGHGGRIRLYSSNGTRLAGQLDVSAAQNALAGTLEVLSSQGATTLEAGARLISRTGIGQPAGFQAIVGDTLAISPFIYLNALDFSGAANDSTRRTEQELAAYLVPPALPFQTDAPVLFHAFSDDQYGSALQALFPPGNPNDGFEAASFVTPVGSLRPNGGVQATSTNHASDPLSAVPVVFTSPASAPAPPPSVEPGAAGTPGAIPPLEAGALLATVGGGPGVARSADLGRGGGVAGANPDVFGVNHHVLTPTHSEADETVEDYLCTTPFSLNGCATQNALAE